jgi:hypothetical protein
MTTASMISGNSRIQESYSGTAEVKWLTQLKAKTLLFYLKPLVSKWLKTFKAPEILIISEQPLDTQLWEKRMKTNSITWMNFEEATQNLPQDLENKTWQMVVMLHKRITQADVAHILPKLQKGGALLLVSENMSTQWKNWESFLEGQSISQTYPVGFHPNGAVAWWPTYTVLLDWLGIIIDSLVAFAPGRYEAALRWGKCWIIRGFKRDDVTLLT